MRVKIIAAVVAVAVLAGTYLAVYWPQRRARMAAEEQARVLEDRLDAAEARVRTGELLGHALTLKEVAEERNYGQAQEMSSKFFDAVRTEAAVVGDSSLRDALSDVLARRDDVTAALARSDPAVTQVVHDIELRLRRALNFTMPPGSVSVP
jgi:hypothetical protein